MKLYMINVSPPVRAVLLTEKALGLKFDYVHMDLMAQDHLKPEYLKINPQHTIPTLVDDDGTVVWDSHAIICYLVDKYGKDDKLYPKDLAKRALINQRLHFESGSLFCVMSRMAKPLWQDKSKVPDPVGVELIQQAYEFCEKFLEGHDWMAGDEVTVADFSLIASISSVKVLVPVDPKLKNLTAWIERCQALPYYSANAEGLKTFETVFKQLIA